MNHESPFAPPRATPDPARPDVQSSVSLRAVLGLLICLYAIVVLGFAAWIAADEAARPAGLRDPENERDARVAVGILLAVGVPSLIGGWRWTDRKRAWPWLLGPGIFHLLAAVGWMALWLAR